MIRKVLALWNNELRSHMRWILYWILGVNTYILMAVSIYPGEKALKGFLGLVESEEYFQAFLGSIGGNNPAYQLWIALMMPFMSIIYFLFAMMLGVKASVGAVTDDTGELIHPQPVRRMTFLAIRFAVGIVAILAMLLVGFGLLMIPFAGVSLPIANIWTIVWWGFLFMVAAMSLGMVLGSLAADTGRGNMFALMVGLALYGLQILGRVVSSLGDVNKYNPLNWYFPDQATLGKNPESELIVKIMILLVIMTLLANWLFVKRDLIKEAAITLPIVTALTRRRSGGKDGGKSDRDRLLVSWARPLEKRLPFTADFIYSERRALLVAFWGVIMFYPAQLMAYKPNDEKFIQGLQKTISSFGNSGFLRVLTYGHDLSGDVYLWFIITQAIGNHWFFFVPLAAHWIKKILVADAENLTGELNGSLPVQGKDVMLQRLLAVLLELVFIVVLMIAWLLLSEAVIGTSYNQVWEVIAIISVIPLYIFLITTGLSLGLLLQEGVKYARLGLLALLIWFITGIMLDKNSGIFGMYDPVLVISKQSLTVAHAGILWLTGLAAVFSAIIIYLSPRYDWLRITNRAPSKFDLENGTSVT